ncbi:hypothetical protein JZ751_014019 [Albula glossodonta]|uniref:ATP synthase peripheral stalk subunit F6, mitochondrial n=1 Tax=Albula glossodonta TaxID=121402 RepID=A0A8T2MXR6_9TELE|nr:hypothetical protein JZ751_014019 [Albula glossodonta]
MAASLLRIGRLGSLKGLQLESWSYLRRVPVSALCTKSGDPKNFKTKKPSLTHLDPIQKLFLDKIREYSAKSQTSGGLVDAGPEYEKTLSEEVTRLQRLYGGSDLTHFPEFQFPEPKLEEAAAK